MSDAVHAEEMRRVDHGRKHIAILRHAHDVLTGMGQVYRALPGHDAEHVERQQRARGVKLGVGVLQEVGNDVRAMPFRMLRLEVEAGVFLVAFGREAHVIELNFVGTGFGRLPGQSDVVLLHLRLRGIGPTSLPFSRHACPVLCDFTASSGWVSTNRDRGRWQPVRWRADSANAGSG